MAILHCLMSLFSNSLFSADMRQHPLRTQTEKFHDRRIFVHKGNGIAFLILGHPVRHRPHMLFSANRSTAFCTATSGWWAL